MKEIPEDYVDDTCKFGKGKECCAFLTMGPGGFMCAKMDFSFRKIIEKRLDEGSIGAKGNNCPGYGHEGFE